MTNTQATRIAIILAFLAALMTPAAWAVTVPFNLNVTITETNANVGTGVIAGDTFIGVMYFDSIDLTPDGSRNRTILPGGDIITIAGITFDTTLNSTLYGFEFSSGAPFCIGDFSLDGCGSGEGQSIPKPDGDALILFDDNSGVIRDSLGGPLGPFEFADLTYSFTAGPGPAALGRLGSAWALLGWLQRKTS